MPVLCPAPKLLRKQAEEAIVHQTAILLVERARVARSSPVEKTTQSILSYIVGLHADSVRGVVRDKTTISTHAVRRTELLVDMFFSTRSREISVFERAFFTSLALERMTYASRSREGSSVRRNAHYDLVRRHSLSRHVRHSRVAGNCPFRTMRDLWSEKLRLVAGFGYPWARVIVSHQVYHVQVLCSVS